MAFPDTRWSHVVRARGREPQAQAALSDLCAAYYEPVRVFLRSEGRDDETARELAQEFFEKLLSGTGVDGAEELRGKFRTFLLGAVKHFLSARRQHDTRSKRGSGMVPEPLSAGTDSAPGIDPADACVLPPDAAFDRQWALTVLERVLNALEAEMRADGREALFAALMPFLTGSSEYGNLESSAARLEMSAAALRVAVHRLRQRYRDLLRNELAQTLVPGAPVEEEVAALKAALRTG
jgi:DNA-directed RNA polymerase specialized sigma24 family protein